MEIGRMKQGDGGYKEERYVVIPWKIAVPVIQAVMVARADAKL